MKRMQRLLAALVVGMVVALLAVPSRRLAQEGSLGGNDEAEAAAKGQVAGDRERLLDREPAREGAPKDDKPGAWSAATQGPIVGPYIRITTDTVQNRDPAVAYNSVRDEFLVVWHQEISSTNWGIFARRVSAAGALVGSTITIDAVGLNRWPEVAYNYPLDRRVSDRLYLRRRVCRRC